MTLTDEELHGIVGGMGTFRIAIRLWLWERTRVRVAK